MRKTPGMTLGERQRLRILAVLAEGPLSAVEIGNRIHMSGAGVLKHTKVMREESPRRAYIENYVVLRQGRPTPLYAAGSLPDAPYDPVVIAQNRHQQLLGYVVAELEKFPRTNSELSTLIGLSVSGVRNLVNELRQMGWCKIVDWAPVKNRNSAPIYGLGFGKDKKKVGRTRAQRWKSEKNNDELHQHRLAKRRAKAAEKRAQARPNTWFGAVLNIRQGDKNVQQQKAA